VAAVGCGLAALALALVWLQRGGIDGIRTSADYGSTEPIWRHWLPALLGSAVVFLGPWRHGRMAHTSDKSGVWSEIAAMFTAAIAFVAVLTWAGGAEWAHTGGKLVLLVAVPLIVMRLCRSEVTRNPPPPTSGSGGPASASLAVAIWAVAWVALQAAGWVARPPPAAGLVVLVAILVLGFAINAVVEEFFYRRWLQTRVEVAWGRWAGVVVATLLWASWHMSLQGFGRPSIDLAAVVVAHAATGLFLGLLWTQYRRMAPLLVVHGLVNALPVVVAYVV
jgi:uncharacterized protein